MVGKLIAPVVFESSILRVTVDSKIVLPKFIFEWLNSPKGVQLMNRIKKFTTVAGITGSDLKKIPIPLIPLKEQRAITHELSSIRNSIHAIAVRKLESRALRKKILNSLLGC